MDTANYKYLAPAFLTACLMACGQILFAMGAKNIDTGNMKAFLISVATNWTLISAISLYALTILIWIYTLKHLPLSLAYPITACAYIFAPILAFYILEDPLPPKMLLGSGMILLGMIVIYN